MGSNKETPHSASTSNLRAVRSNKCIPLHWSCRKPVTTADVSLVVGETLTENPRGCEDDDSKSNDNASMECDNHPSSDGEYDDTDDSKSDDNGSTEVLVKL
ncbi:hypothetical protein ACFE04_021177 [Oxalis oulophora]